METWQVEISEQMQISNILGSIEDDLIRDEYIALTGRKNGLSEKAPDELRHEMERILLENPDRMLLFMTAEMREMLSKLLQQEWIDGSGKCVLAKLYSFGFCIRPSHSS